MLRHLENILLKDDIQEIWRLHGVIMAQYGFDRLLYVFLPFTASPGFESPDDAFTLSSFSPEYTREYLTTSIFSNAPIITWTARNSGACSWSWIQNRRDSGLLTPAELKVCELDDRYDVKAGITISFTDKFRRSRGAMSLCAEPGLTQAEVDELWERHQRELMLINSVLHLRISTMPLTTAKRALTDRQRQVLEWVADGKTVADIALIMGLTIATVEKHLRLAREVLNVETTAQAVLKATMQRQLFIGLPPKH